MTRFIAYAITGLIVQLILTPFMPWYTGGYWVVVFGSWLVSLLLYGMVYLFLLGANAFLDFLNDETKR